MFQIYADFPDSMSPVGFQFSPMSAYECAESGGKGQDFGTGSFSVLVNFLWLQHATVCVGDKTAN